MKIGEKIVELRNMRGLTQTNLAKMVGMSRGYLSEIETCRKETNLTLDMLKRIAEALDVSLECLVAGTDGNSSKHLQTPSQELVEMVNKLDNSDQELVKDFIKMLSLRSKDK